MVKSEPGANQLAAQLAGWSLDDLVDWDALYITEDEIREIQGSQDPFNAADSALLHGAPIYPDREKEKTYVVFVGREPGVYMSWYAFQKFSPAYFFDPILPPGMQPIRRSSTTLEEP